MSRYDPSEDTPLFSEVSYQRFLLSEVENESEESERAHLLALLKVLDDEAHNYAKQAYPALLVVLNFWGITCTSVMEMQIKSALSKVYKDSSWLASGLHDPE